MPKILKYEKDARESLKRGIDTVANAVKVTLGPKGRNVLIGRPHRGEPDITNDGATIARNITVEDPFEEQGVQLLKSVASRTESNAGDGTTTSSILAQAMVGEGLKVVDEGANPVLLRKGIELAVEQATEYLKSKAKPVTPEELPRIATLSAEDEEIGGTIAKILNDYGKDASITVEDGSYGISYEMVDGYKFDKGWASPYLMNRHDRFESVLEDAYILILNQRIAMVDDIVPIVEKFVKETGKREFVLIAEAIEGEALTSLVLSKLQGKFHILAINAPGFGNQRSDILEDIAIFTGATKLGGETGFKPEEIEIGHFGKCQKIIANRETTNIIGGAGSETEVQERVKQLDFLVEQNKDGGTEYFERQLKDRIGKLTGKAAILRIGYDSDIEAKYKKLKIEDTIAATKAALEEGILPGGGIMYLAASKAVEDAFSSTDLEDDVKTGIEIVVNALCEPIRQLARNSGGDPDTVMRKVDERIGFNALTGEFVDMYEASIFDPLKVERLALINAASVAKTLLTAEVLIVDKPEEKK